MQPRHITIFDTTLRDGEQTPGVCLDMEDKLEIARTLSAMGVDIIEAGFPAASPGDFAAVQAVAAQVKGPVIAALARAGQKDIDAAYQALKGGERTRIHTFIATSDIHLIHKLRMTRDQVLAAAEDAVRYARSKVSDVEFSAEDASRSDWDFLCRIFTRAIEAGASTINIPDTVGYATPAEFGRLIAYIRENVPNIDAAAISVHCHNDLGMAVANSLTAIQQGAAQVECTINGIGERAGNAAMEELVMALHTRPDYYHAETGIRTSHIYRASRTVSILSGINVQPNKAIVGDNAFSHESGIHQHGVLNNPLTYEVMHPHTIGLNRNSLVLGKLSGRHAFEDRLRSLGYDITGEKLDALFARFKELADRKKTVFDKDIEALITDKVPAVHEWYHLNHYRVTSTSRTMAKATVILETANGSSEQASWGSGPVNAVFSAIEKAIGIPCCLKDYQVKAVTSGEDALGEATVWLEYDNQVFYGRGLSTDVMEASAKAFINGINKLLAVCPISRPQQSIGGEY